MADDVTEWLHRLSDGDEQAAKAIWDRYFTKLIRLARHKLEGLPLREADEEDVALSAMRSFFRGVEKGRFTRLDDRDDLWRLLVKITAHKAVAQARRVRSQKRGGGHGRGNSAFLTPDAEHAGRIDDVMGNEPTPALAAEFAENCRRLLDQLRDPALQEIANQKLEGYTNAEIAQQRQVAVRTVERKLERIRHIWQSRQSPS